MLSNESLTLKSNAQYVYSMEVMSNKDINVNNTYPLHHHIKVIGETGAHGGSEYVNLISNKAIKANSWSKIVLQFKTIEGFQISFTPYIYLSPNGVNVKVRYIKLEEGTSPTPWIPHKDEM